MGYDASKNGEFQLGITGTVKRGESKENAARRETVEELGIEISDIQPATWKTVKRKTIHTFITDASKCKITETMKYANKRNDDWKQKIIVLIHGNLIDIISLMKQFNIEIGNSENIAYIAAIKISKAIELCKILVERGEPYLWITN